MNAMLLCAGLGTRFRPLTDKIAKPAIPFLGWPLCGYPLYYLEQIGLKQLVVNTHHLPDTVHKAIERCSSNGYEIHFSHEDPILGSGGGIKKAQKYLETEDHFFVINGDEIFFPQDKKFLEKALQYHIKSEALATIVTCEDMRAGCEIGSIKVDGAKILDLGVRYEREKFEQLSKRERAQLKHNSGIYIYSKRVFDYMPTHSSEFHIFKDCLIPALKRGEKLMSYHMPDLIWLDMSSDEDYMNSTARALHLLEQDNEAAEILKQILARAV